MPKLKDEKKEIIDNAKGNTLEIPRMFAPRLFLPKVPKREKIKVNLSIGSKEKSIYLKK